MEIKLDIGDADINLALKDVIYDKYIQEKIETRLKRYLEVASLEQSLYVKEYDWNSEKNKIIKRLEALEKKCKITSD